MQISTSSNAYESSGAQRMLAALLEQQGSGSGQDLQSTQGPDKGPPPGGPPPGPPPGGGASGQFSSDTLSSLLSVQQEDPTSSDIASKLISDADTDGDGALSLDEIKKALTGDESAQTSSTPTASSTDDSLSKALSKLDTNGDGKLSSSELASALDSFKATHKHGHHHRAAEATATTTTEATATETATTTETETA